MKAILFILSMLFLWSCGIEEDILKFDGPNQEVRDFFSDINLIRGSGNQYWIVGSPPGKSRIGGVYKKVEKIIQGVKYVGFKFHDPLAFQTALRPQQLETNTSSNHSRSYSYKRELGGDIAILNFFSLSASNLFQVEQKVELSSITAIKAGADIRFKNFSENDLYYVHEVYEGSSSFIGLVQRQFSASFGRPIKVISYGKLHEIKQGVLSFTLLPIRKNTTVKKPPLKEEVILKPEIEQVIEEVIDKKKDEKVIEEVIKKEKPIKDQTIEERLDKRVYKKES